MNQYLHQKSVEVLSLSEQPVSDFYKFGGANNHSSLKNADTAIDKFDEIPFQ